MQFDVAQKPGDIHKSELAQVIELALDERLGVEYHLPLKVAYMVMVTVHPTVASTGLVPCSLAHPGVNTDWLSVPWVPVVY